MKHFERMTGIKAAIPLVIAALLLTASGCSTAESSPKLTPPLTVALT